MPIPEVSDTELCKLKTFLSSCGHCPGFGMAFNTVLCPSREFLNQLAKPCSECGGTLNPTKDATLKCANCRHEVCLVCGQPPQYCQ